MLTVKASCLWRSSELAPGQALVGASAGPQNDLVLLTSEGPPQDYTAKEGETAIQMPNRFRIHHHTPQWMNVINLPATAESFDFAQPLGAEAWLLARRRAANPHDCNLSIYGADGRFQGAFPAGDGIQDVQATLDAHIWVSYSHPASDEESGRSGFVCYHADGQPLFRFDGAGGCAGEALHACALNVAYRDEAWLYYSPNYPLVRVRRQKIDREWLDIPVKGAHAFAVLRDQALFADGFGDEGKLQRVSLETLTQEEVLPLDSDGEPIRYTSAFGRSFRLYLRTDAALFVVDLNDIDELS